MRQICVMIISTLLAFGCASPRPEPTEPPLVLPAFTPTDLPIETATSTPTATVLAERDLHAAYIEEISKEFMGVEIMAKLITDETVANPIERVTISEGVYAEVVARSMFRVWWQKGIVEHRGIGTDEDFEVFMGLWSQAQDSGLEVDWEKVQINGIWANDLDDGEGFIQQPYNIWPMHEGVSPEGLRGVDLAIVLVGERMVHDHSMTNEQKEYMRYRTHIDSETLYIYIAPYPGYTNKESVASGIGAFSSWLMRNSGGKLSTYLSEARDFFDLLEVGISIEYNQ